ncbi:hypothetical protein [Acidaminobacter hydrogenoformans]|uniref:Uncharacterized protein n=1 Tax=Acidaminobacter hydrogenoformans DSM 2784 TaxID=1120920 RepID=A0A1G5S677_9FIRM|nr:hypothetical protein [Acidaminobacter hydrogenoformans]SCZ81587.1 hypothetical protein SAMN03080599_02868 [Acidaminobacter hydrogenoformans DSM 2784]
MVLYEMARDAMKLLQKSDNIELIQKLMDIQKESLEMFEENIRLKAEIRAFNEVKTLDEDLEFRDNCFFKISNGEGPFCITCWGKDRKLIRMQIADDFALCNVCKTGTCFTNE